MSAFSTILRPLPAARRAYSVFTKPGGGRYFNSAKPLQASNKKGKTDAAPASQNGDTSAAGNVVEEATPSPSGPSLANANDAKPSLITPSLSVNFTPFPIHPAVNPHDLKLHQFFSLHRPLLNIAQPGSSVFDAPSGPFVFPPGNTTENANAASFDEPPEASPESDADAARQLARAMVVNRVGAALSWDHTLQKLGLDEAAGRAEEVSLAQAEYDMYMDSTKRKRRRKMKKHKYVFVYNQLTAHLTWTLFRLKKRRRVRCKHSAFHGSMTNTYQTVDAYARAESGEEIVPGLLPADTCSVCSFIISAHYIPNIQLHDESVVPYPWSEVLPLSPVSFVGRLAASGE